MHHGPAVELKEDKAIAKKTRLGVILFFVYLIVYAGFVTIGMVFPHAMGMELIGGQNIAVIYGMGLIILAVVMGLIYNAICTKYENQMNKENQK
ncbi:MAG: hypothetical protein CVU11_13710 [Bacteroidetes bacterium HGW-Bacteroidetes-6]|jgi:uncharacterized membrane protein (DUF485 family)|nr:MAG: hypothetical protein CVU11_13710 [Bacteroidetes bacterium HGW-Bacteroidetes-6]